MYKVTFIPDEAAAQKQNKHMNTKISYRDDNRVNRLQHYRLVSSPCLFLQGA